MALENSEIVAFLPITQIERAREFYCDVLGLRFEKETPFALVVRGPNALLRLAKVQSFIPLPFTVLGWQVSDIEATAKQLLSKGVSFERYDGMKQDDLGIWISPSDAKVCWFKDPDGNVLSLTQFLQAE